MNLNLTVSSPDKLPIHFSIQIPEDYSKSEPVVHVHPVIDHAYCDSENHGKIDLIKLMNKWKKQYGLQEVVDCLIKFNTNPSAFSPLSINQIGSTPSSSSDADSSSSSDNSEASSSSSSSEQDAPYSAEANLSKEDLEMQNIFTTHLFLISLNIPSSQVSALSLTQKYEYILKNDLSEKYKGLLKSKKIPDQIDVFEKEYEKLRNEKDVKKINEKLRKKKQKFL